LGKYTAGQAKYNLGEPLRGLCPLASGYARFASLIPAPPSAAWYAPFGRAATIPLAKKSESFAIWVIFYMFVKNINSLHIKTKKMANLTYLEQDCIESFLNMKSGYVLDFTNSQLKEFIKEAIGLDIYDNKYTNPNGAQSKAKILKQFIKIESNYIVGKLLVAFYNYYINKMQRGEPNFHYYEELFKEYHEIAKKLIKENPAEHIYALKPDNDDKNFNLLYTSIKESIDKNEPEGALDRLHTYLVKYIRSLCEKHQITYKKDDPLNSIFGKYIKEITSQQYVESEMAVKILKYAINIIEAFNDIRNNKSLAHDNPILNYEESILILNNISIIVRYIESVEFKITQKNTKIEDSDLPF
jgi:hypothetical protein